MNENENSEMDDGFEDEFEDADDEKSTAEYFREGFEARKADRQAEEEADQAEKVKFLKHTDESGEFKTLKDEYEYFGDPLPKSLGPGGPDPAKYSPGQQEQFERDSIAYYRSGGTKLANNIDAAPDDPHGPKRRELARDFSEWTEKQIIAKENADFDGEDRAKYFKKIIAKELKELPEPPFIKHQRDLVNHAREEALEMAFNEETALEDWWQGERIKGEDGPTLAAEQIIEGNSDVLYLPKQVSEGSHNMREFVPANVIKYPDLPREVVESIKRQVHYSSDKSPEAVFKVAWDVLNTGGYAARGVLSPAAEKAKKSKAKTKPKKEEPKQSNPASIEVVKGMFPG